MQKDKSDNNPGGGRNVELLTHFNCTSCQKWWSIGDALIDKVEWFCPWCGEKQNFN